MLTLDAAAVARRLGRLELVEALQRAFAGEYVTPERQHLDVGGVGSRRDSLLIMPAWRPGGSVGVKLVTVFPGNSRLGQPAVHAAYVMFDGATGVPLAMLDGSELTRRRTAAASALAAKHLARADSSRLLMVGTGALAPHIIESYAAVLPIRSVRIWGRRLERAQALALTLAGQSFAVTAVDDLRAAVEWADIVSCATLAETPLVCGAWLHPGQHLDLIGSFTPAMREADDEALQRSRLFVDTRAGALRESGELLHAIASGAITESAVAAELAELVRGTHPGRRTPGEITVFKSVGCALEDLAAAELVLGK